MSDLHRVRQCLTPALFARAATDGRFLLPRHVAAISEAICDTITGRSEPILLIEAPPRHGKSELVSKFLPAWYLGVWPDRRVMLAAYEATFARSWGRKARQVFVESTCPVFGRGLSGDNSAADDWSTTAGGGMSTAGVGGPMTGRGAHLLIIDDPVKNAEEALSATTRENHWDWWQSTASTRLEPGGVVIGIMTRWHEDDIFGRLLKSGGQIRRLTLPALAEPGDVLGRQPGEALWPERYPVQRLEQMRRERSEYWWRALFQQRPGKWGESKWGQFLGDRCMAARWPEAFDVGVVAVDRTKNWEYASIAGARKCEDGTYETELVAGFAGATEQQLYSKIHELYARGTIKAIAVDDRQMPNLVKRLKIDGLPIWPLWTKEISAACSTVYAMFSSGVVKHRNDPLLVVQSPRGIAKYTGETWLISRRESLGDIDALMATVMALYVSATHQEYGIQVF